MHEILLNSPLLNIMYFTCMLIFIGFSFKRVMDYADAKENKRLIEKFEHIHAILTFHMDGAFETIHKDNILVFSLDGVKPKEEDIDKLSHEFVKLTLRLAGPNMLKIFVELYGDEDTLFFVMIDYFNRRFEDDEIRASAIQNIQDSEVI